MSCFVVAARYVLAFLPLLVVPGFPGLRMGLVAQEGDATALAPALTNLPDRIVEDRGCDLAAFTQAQEPSPDQAAAALRELFGREPEKGRFDLILYLRTRPVSEVEPERRPDARFAGVAGAEGIAPNATVKDSLSWELYDAGRHKFLEAGRKHEDGRKLYEAQRLRIVALLAQPEDSTLTRRYAVHAGTAVHKQASLLARGLPFLFGEFLGALLAPPTGRTRMGCGTYDVFTHVTTIGVPDATVRTRVEVKTSPAVEQSARDSILRTFERQRTEIEFRYLGYTDLKAVFDAMETTLQDASCTGRQAADCLHALDEAALRAVDSLKNLQRDKERPFPEHTIRALREATAMARDAIEEHLGERTASVEEAFHVVNRPRIGFSVGGLLFEEAGDKVEFEVEDGRVVAEGVEGDGFKSLILLDLYLRRVDIGEDATAFLPHASVGFTIGDVLQPGAFVATTLPLTAGRLSPFAGFILRRETEDASSASDGAEPSAGEAEIEEQRRFRFVAGLKLGLPVPP